jgi:hypothetical protein
LAALQFGLVAGSAQAAPSKAAPLFLFDRSIEGAADAAKIATDAGIKTTSFHHDIGAPWLDTIEPLWRINATPVAGITYGGAFFCLEHLAQSHRLTCTARSPLTAGQDLGPAVAALLRFATIGSPSRRAPVAMQPTEYGDAPVLWLLQPIRPTI